MISKRQYEVILSIMLYGILIVDSLNGLLLKGFKLDIKISIIYKFLFLVVGVIFLAKFNRNKFILSCCLIFYMLCWSSLKNINGSFFYFFQDFGNGIKLISVILVFNIISSFSATSCKDFMFKFIAISSLVVILNISASFFGYGFSTYEGFGAKGFFYSGNALTGVVAVLSVFILSCSYMQYLYKFFLSFILLLFFASLIGTKGAVLAVLLSFFLVLFNQFRFTVNKVFVVFLVFISLVLFYNFNNIVSSEMYLRLQYFYESGGVVRALLSDRDLSFIHIYSYFITSDVITLLWGMGADYLTNVVGDSVVEMDLADLVFTFGLLTTVLYLVLLSLILFLSSKDCGESDKFLVLFRSVLRISSFILLLVSFFAGHILFNGLVTFIWGLILAAPLWQKNNLKLGG
jgi:hypothetical protein